MNDGILHCFDENGMPHKYKPVDKLDPMEPLEAWTQFNARVTRTYHETLGQRYGTLTKDL